MASALYVRCSWPRSQALVAWRHPKRAHAGVHGCVLVYAAKKGRLCTLLARACSGGHAGGAHGENRVESEAGKRRAHRGVDGERVVG
jgi:hypothetical protein